MTTALAKYIDIWTLTNAQIQTYKLRNKFEVNLSKTAVEHTLAIR